MFWIIFFLVPTVKIKSLKIYYYVKLKNIIIENLSLIIDFIKDYILVIIASYTLRK
jgi:hypothetical protein